MQHCGARLAELKHSAAVAVPAYGILCLDNAKQPENHITSSLRRGVFPGIMLDRDRASKRHVPTS